MNSAIMLYLPLLMRYILLNLLFSQFFLFGDSVLITLSPYKEIIQDLTQEKVDICVLVPPGVSPHSYEPTFKSVSQCRQGKLFFTIGEPFESFFIQKLKSINPDLKIVNLDLGIDKIGEGCCSPHSFDTHFWVSPLEMRIQAKIIKENLILLLPAEKEEIEKNWLLLEKKFDHLDLLAQQVGSLSKKSKKAILVNHSSYAYLARDYGITITSLEKEGREPSFKELQTIRKTIKEQHIGYLFTQPEYPSKLAEALAREENLQLILLNPYSPDYFEAMEIILNKFLEAL